MTYKEGFDDGPGGWHGWIDNFQGPGRLLVRDGSAISHSPWWIDYNHAPPGAGYLHMLFCLPTKASTLGEAVMDAGGRNRFIDSGCGTDFTDARITIRSRGELDARGASMVLLCQAGVDGVVSGWALTSQPLHVTSGWSEQTLHLRPDPAQWTALGSRHDRTAMYGVRDLGKVLRDVNSNIMLILFPLDVAAMLPVARPHEVRAGRDYPVWQRRLPDGYVLLDEIRIDFAQ
ncbi:MAG: hypothetical protein U0Q16_19295 [Bryobacteraceae bacterium]